MGEREAEKNHFDLWGSGFLITIWVRFREFIIIFVLRFLHLCVWSGAGPGDIIFSPLLCFMDRKEYIS